MQRERGSVNLTIDLNWKTRVFTFNRRFEITFEKIGLARNLLPKTNMNNKAIILS